METENKNLKDNIRNQQNDLISKYENENTAQVAGPKTTQSDNLEPKAKTFQKALTPYQQYKQSKNKNGGKYFQFYDDIKVYTHNIYDW